QIEIAHAEQRRIVGAKFLYLRLIFLQPLVTWPVQDRAGISGRVFFAKSSRREKWLVGVKTLQMQQPVVSIAIEVEKLKAGSERARTAEVALLAHEMPIDHGLNPAVLLVGRMLHWMIHGEKPFKGRLDHRLPFIPFLSAHEFPGSVPVMVGGASILPVMVMIRNQMGIYVMLAQQF